MINNQTNKGQMQKIIFNLSSSLKMILVGQAIQFVTKYQILYPNIQHKIIIKIKIIIKLDGKLTHRQNDMQNLIQMLHHVINQKFLKVSFMNHYINLLYLENVQLKLRYFILGISSIYYRIITEVEMTQLPSLNRRNSDKKRPLGLNDRISLKIKAKLNPLEQQNPTTDTQLKGTFQDLDEKYAKDKRRRTQFQNMHYNTNSTLKFTPPSSSEGTKQNSTIGNIQRKVRFLLQKHEQICEYISKNDMKRQNVLNEITQPFFMLHLLQGVRNQQQLHILILKKIKSISELQKSKNNYQTSQTKMEKLFRERMKFLNKHLE